MIAHEIRKKLQNIVRGALLEGQEDHCTTIRNLLVESFGTSSTVKKEFESRAILKEKQARFLRSHSEKVDLWLTSLPCGSEYVTRGGESQVYFAGDKLKELLTFNAFENTRRQDYYNKEFGLVLEDMHDENVIARQGVLFSLIPYSM